MITFHFITPEKRVKKLEKTKLEPLSEHPLVSIIVPSYNQGAFIRQTIESCLEQDYRPIEIIVMDGASTDNTVEVLESFGDIPELNWISEPDDGVVDAVNKGLKKAKGEIAAIQSSDDYYLPNAFSTVVDAFQSHPDAGMIFGDVERVDAEGQHQFFLHQPPFSLARLLSREVLILQQASFFRRELAVSIGGWNPEIPYVPDTDLWIRLAFHFGVGQCRAVLAAGRRHPGQRDINRERIYSDYLKMLRLSSELATAPIYLKLAAKAGAALLKFRYGGPWANGQLLRAAWTALLCRPALIRSPVLPNHRLVPGYFALTRLKQKLGCWMHERWRTEWVLRAPTLARRRGMEWQDLCNRNETVLRFDGEAGRTCSWNDSSLLTVCRVFPRVGNRLLRHTWTTTNPAGIPAPVSIILPVRGLDRFEPVQRVANTLIQMAGPDSEVLLCEHDVSPNYDRQWPRGIRPVFIPAKEGEAFNKSRAMNAGARAARCSLLLFHDLDMFPPPDYLFQTLEKISRGWDAVRPIRFLFLLDERSSQTVMQTGGMQDLKKIEQVKQNFPGLSTAILRDTYLELGGHDERFVGWGGEDLEFLDRLQTCKLYPGSFLPAIHLWHPPAEQKHNRHGNADLLKSILAEPRALRIEACRKKMERHI